MAAPANVGAGGSKADLPGGWCDLWALADEISTRNPACAHWGHRTALEVALVLGGSRIGLVLPCRVVHVVDEPRRRGFAYGTLPGHPEQGEESFMVSHEPDGSVVLRISAFSRPGNALSRLCGPLARWVQDRMTNRYVDAARPPSPTR